MNTARTALLLFGLSACVHKTNSDTEANQTGTSPATDTNVDTDSETDDGGDSGDAPSIEPWTIEPGLHAFIIEQEVAGVAVEREVLVHTPEDPPGPLPAVFAFHGAGGENDSWVNGLRPMVDAGAFIGVYPQGHDGFWALGPEPSEADDIAFVNLIVAALSPSSAVDSERLYAIGSSNGAGLTHRLGIETDHFRAFAALATALGVDPIPAPGEHTETVLQIHGMDDEVCPYAGGESGVGHTFLHAETSAATWAEAIGCTGEPITEDKPNGDRWLTWAECPEGRSVLHIGLADQGHGLPGGFMGGLLDFVWGFLKTY